MAGLALSSCESSDGVPDDAAATDGTDDGGEATDGADDDDDDSADDDDDDADSSGGDPPPTGPYVDGERLEALVSRSADGLEAFERWYDTELERYCFWGHVGDGEFRCLPSSFGSFGFADAGCTEPAVLAGCSAPKVVSQWLEPFCSGTIGEYRVWDVGAATSTVYRRDADDECVEWTDVTGYRLQPRGVDDFVRGEVQRVELGGLARNELSADDGARMWMGPILTDSDEFCEIRDVDGSTRCVSYNRAFHQSSLHTDASCTSADVLIDGSDAACDQPGIALLQTGELVGVGEPLAAEALYVGNGPESCSEQTSPIDFPLHRVAPLDADDLPSAQILLEGDGRLQRRAPATSDGEVLGVTSPAWYDSEHGFACVGVDAGDTTVCRPSLTVGDTDFFADSQCNEPLFRQGNLAAGWYARFTGGGACEPSSFLEAVRIGDPWLGAAWRLTNTGCDPVEDVESYQPLFDLKERLGPAQLATLEF